MCEIEGQEESWGRSSCPPWLKAKSQEQALGSNSCQVLKQEENSANQAAGKQRIHLT